MDFLYPYSEDKLKPYMKMAIHRIQLLKNKKTTSVKHQKREIATLLSDKQNEKAQIKVEQIIREDFTIEGLEILEIIISLLSERIKLITNSKSYPPADLLESISSIIWASKNIEIEELSSITDQFKKKYGKKFIDRIFLYTNLLTESQQILYTKLSGLNGDIDTNTSLRSTMIDEKMNEIINEGGPIEINDRLFNKLSYRPPSAYLVVRYLEEIARSFNVDWKAEDELGIEDINTLSTVLPLKSMKSIGSSVRIAPASGITTAYIQPTETKIFNSPDELPSAPSSTVSSSASTSSSSTTTTTNSTSSTSSTKDSSAPPAYAIYSPYNQYPSVQFPQATPTSASSIPSKIIDSGSDKEVVAEAEVVSIEVEAVGNQSENNQELNEEIEEKSTDEKPVDDLMARLNKLRSI